MIIASLFITYGKLYLLYTLVNIVYPLRQIYSINLQTAYESSQGGKLRQFKLNDMFISIKVMNILFYFYAELTDIL